MVGIYKITSATDKIYIGQSWNINKRFREYKNLYCSKQLKIYNSIIKHGWKNHKFEIIHQLPSDISQNVMDGYEIFYWQQYKDCGFDMLNIREPGSQGKHDQETIDRIVKTNRDRGHYDNLQNRLNSDDAKEKRMKTMRESGYI